MAIPHLPITAETLLLVSHPPGFTVKAVWYPHGHCTPAALTCGLVLAAGLVGGRGDWAGDGRVDSKGRSAEGSSANV